MKRIIKKVAGAILDPQIVYERNKKRLKARQERIKHKERYHEWLKEQPSAQKGAKRRTTY